MSRHAATARLATVTDRERETLELALERMRRTTSSNGRKMTFGELLQDLRDEAAAQEKAGARKMTDVLDAAHNLILAALIDRDDKKFFRGGRK